jgi:hypothetical protein
MIIINDNEREFRGWGMTRPTATFLKLSILK